MEALSAYFLACWLLVRRSRLLRHMPYTSADLTSNHGSGSQMVTILCSVSSQGDTSNLLGCLLAANQLPTQVYTAMYFIVSRHVRHCRFNPLHSDRVLNEDFGIVSTKECRTSRPEVWQLRRFMMTQYVYYRALERHRQRVEAAQLRRQQRHLHYHGLPQHDIRIRPPEFVDPAAAAVRRQSGTVLLHPDCPYTR